MGEEIFRLLKAPKRPKLAGQIAFKYNTPTTSCPIQGMEQLLSDMPFYSQDKDLPYLSKYNGKNIQIY
jgi:hypothetical protein